MKRVFLFCLSLLIGYTITAQNFDFSSVAPSGQTLYYKIMTSNTVSVVYPNYNSGDYWSGYTKPSSTLTIPSTVTDNGSTYTVTSVGAHAFYNCISIEYLNLPSTLTSIGNYAFYGCSHIYHIVIPEGVTSVGDYAFHSNSLAYDISLPNSLTHIGSLAFYGVSVTELTIPRNVQYIGTRAFNGNSQTFVLNYNADSCVNGGSNQSTNQSPFNTSNISTLNIGSHVRHIPTYVFAGAPLSSVSFPESVRSIGPHAFYQCTSLLSISWGTGVEIIEKSAFEGCNSIESFSLPTNIKVIGESAFSGIPTITTLTIPSSLDTICQFAFRFCSNLTTVYFNADSCVYGYHNTSSPNPIFPQCPHLTTVVFGNNVKSIPERLFSNCLIETVNIPNSVKTIGKYAFYNNNDLQTIHIGSGLEEIGQSAFASCSQLSAVDFPSSLKAIADDAFTDCTGLTSVTIPSEVKTIGVGAFWNCTNLDTLFFNADSCEIMASTGSSTIGPNYRSSTWNYRPPFQNLKHIVVGSNVKSIPDNAFKDCKISSITIPNSVKYIGKCAFLRCDSLTSITIGTGVETIGDYAFHQCSSLSGINLPNSLLHIGDYAFAYSGLNSLTIPANVNSIGEYILSYAANLNSIYSLATVPPGITQNTFRTPNLGGIHPYTKPIYVSCTALESYRNANHWSMFNHWNLLSGNYAIHISSHDENQGTVDYVTSDCQSGSATIEATPSVHYRFTHWNDGNSDNPRTITLTQDTVLTAYFEKDTFVVSATSIDDSLGTVWGGGTYFRGDTANVFAFANGRNWFAGWDNGSTDNPLSFIVQGDISVTASFAQPPVDTTYIYDTTIVTQYDTTYVDNYIHDTTYVDNYIHDTTYVDNYIHDTTYVDNYIHDTTYVDNYIHDTTYVDIYIHDTTIVTDTLWLTQYDTIWMYDTIVIHDTVYVTQEGVEEAFAVNMKVFAHSGQIVVTGAEERSVRLYDISGRLLAVKQDYTDTLRFDVPSSGAYIIKADGLAAKKIVVIK